MIKEISLVETNVSQTVNRKNMDEWMNVSHFIAVTQNIL